MLHRALFVCISLLLCASSAHAHFVWLEFPEQDGEIHMGFTETPGRKTRETMQDKVMGFAVKDADGNAVEMKKAEGAIKGALSGQKLAGGSLLYGVLDRSSENRGIFLLQYHAKAAKALDDAGAMLGLPVEVIATKGEAGIHLQVLKDGQPAPGAELTLSRAGSDEETELKADDQGKAQLPTSEPGLLGIRAMVAEEKSGEHDGQSYHLTRHYSTLTFRATQE